MRECFRFYCEQTGVKWVQEARDEDPLDFHLKKKKLSGGRQCGKTREGPARGARESWGGRSTH